MRKMRFITVWVLCFVFIGSVFCTVINEVLAQVNSDNFSWDDEYIEQTFSTLNEKTHRGEVARDVNGNIKSPQITVFTYGCGGKLSHWSNNQADNPSGEYKFEYEKDSILEQYVDKFNGKYLMYIAKVSERIVQDRGENAVAVIPQTKDDFSGKYINGNEETIIGDTEFKLELFEVNKNTDDPEKPRYEISNVIGTSHDGTEENRIDKLPSEVINNHIVILFEVDDKDEYRPENTNSNNTVDSSYFDGDGQYCSNDYVYAQFEFVLDVISYQYRQITNELPMYNLIAHSRGGLTNLQYALGHPNNVASLFSMGTPYNGTNFGSATINGSHFFVEDVAGMDADSNGVEDILNSGLYTAYQDIWNAGRTNTEDGRYNHIKFVPIGSYVTMGFVCQLLADFLITEFELGWFAKVSLRTVAVALEAYITYHTVTNIKIPTTFWTIQGILKSIIKRYVNDEDSKNGWIGILDSFSGRTRYKKYKHIGFSLPSVLYIEDDLFIDLDSQVANGYTGAEPVVKLMDTIDQMEGGKSTNDPGVAHNLETHDDAIINYIISNADTSGRAVVVEENASQETNSLLTKTVDGVVYTYTATANEVSITKISGASGEFVIPPNLVEGKIITRIESSVFESLTQTYSMRSTTVNEITEITLPSTVERIEPYAFAGCTSLQTVTINSSAGVSVGAEAFAGCTSLSTVNLGNVTEIGYGAFANCNSLTNITIPANITKIEDYAFYNTNIEQVSFSNNITEIGRYAFAKCSNLENVTIPATVTKIDDFAFYNSGISSVSFEAGSQLTEIGHYAFANCSSLSGMVIPSTVTTIGRGAFMNATALTSVSYTAPEPESTSDLSTSIGDLAFYGCTSLYLEEIPNVQSIGSLAFAGCNWINANASNITLTIPAGVQSIGAGAFYGCSQIAGFSLASGNSYFHVVDGVLYVKQTNEDGAIEYYLHTYPTPKEASGYTAIDSLVGVLDYAFAGNVSLTTINLANVQDIGENAFEDCTNLTTITVDSTNEYYTTNDGVLFNKDATCLIYYPLGKTNSSYIIPTTVTEITLGAFAGNTYLTTITVDSANEYYSTRDDGVLFNKDATCLIYYPLGKTNSTYTVYTTVTEIALGAFAGNTNLTSVNLTNVQIIGDNAFEDCTNLATITGNSVIEAHSSAFEGTPWYTTQSQAEYFGLGKVLFKYNGSYDASGVLDLRTYAAIEENAFPSLNEEGEYIPNTQLTTVYLGEDYSQFNYLSFNNCTALNKVYLLNSEVVQINALTDTLKEQLTFYVPYSLYSSYTATYEDLSFEAIQTTINFYVGEELLDTQTAYYGEVFTTDKVPTVTGNNIFLGWYDTTAYTSTFVGSTYEEFEAEDDLYAKILPTYTLRFVTGIATTCSDITGVYEGKTVRLPNVTQLNYSGSWKNNGANYAFNANMVFFPGAFIVEENNVITFTAAWTTCTHGSKKYVSTSSSTHNVICNTCGYTTSSSHMWSVQSNGTYKCRFCKYVTAIIPINPLKVEDEEIIQSLGEAEEGEIITASNGLSYIYLNREFYLVTQQEDLLFLPKNEESE